MPEGGYRLFYTAVGPAKPYARCQGYISARVPTTAYSSIQSPAFASRGSADRPTVICSAVSDDLLHWKHEDGIRLAGFDGVGGPRYLKMPDGLWRISCFASECVEDRRQSIVSAASSDGLIDPASLRHTRRTDSFGSGLAASSRAAATTAKNWMRYTRKNMSLVEIEDGQYRMCYAACERC